jgi:hypothetical protein
MRLSESQMHMVIHPVLRTRSSYVKIQYTLILLRRFIHIAVMYYIYLYLLVSQEWLIVN